MLIKTNKAQKQKVLFAAYVVNIIQPIIVLPQIIEIFSSQSATDVSLLTWALLVLFNAANLIYGLVFDIKPLIIGNTLWVIMDSIVVIGILSYS